MEKTNQREEKCMLDSGTTSHMTPHSNWLNKTSVCNIEVKLSDDSIIEAKAKGVRSVEWKTETGTRKVDLSEILHVPKLSASFLSVPTLANKNNAVLFLQKLLCCSA